MTAVTLLAVLAALVGPACFYVGLRLGCSIQYRAQHGQRPPELFTRPQKSEITDEPGMLEQAAERETMTAELLQLDKDSLKDRAEFYNIPFDDQPQHRGRVIAQIVAAHFNPGVFKA